MKLLNTYYYSEIATIRHVSKIYLFLLAKFTVLSRFLENIGDVEGFVLFKNPSGETLC